jgi:hypothetical protein
MADDSLLEKVHDLSDLELAVLLCLIRREHCLISTPVDALDDLIEELKLVLALPPFSLPLCDVLIIS